jgi:hypothetical protein
MKTKNCATLSEAQNPVPSPLQTVYTYIQHTYSHRGGGESWTREKVRGVNNSQSWVEKYQHDWLYHHSINSDKYRLHIFLDDDILLWCLYSLFVHDVHCRTLLCCHCVGDIFSFKVVDLEDELKTIGENMKILEVEEEKALAREEKFQARRETFCRARIFKPLKEPRNRFSAWGPVRQPYLTYRPARLHSLSETIHWNRLLVSWNVYKYGLCFNWSPSCIQRKPFLAVLPKNFGVSVSTYTQCRGL